MIPLIRNKKKIYVCPYEISNGVSKFGTPKSLYEYYEITNSESDVALFGLDNYKYIRIVTSASHKKYYTVGNRIYVYNKPPQKDDPLCKNADYEVYKPPIETENTLTVLLRQRSGK